MLSISVLTKKGLSLLSFIVSHSTSLRKLVSKRDLQLGKHVSRVLKLLELTEEISIFSSKFSLLGLNVTKSQVGLFNLLAHFIKTSLEVLQALLSRCLASVNFISCSTSISNLMHDDSLVLLNLGFDLVQLFNLLLHLSNSILVLLFQSNDGSLLLNL